MKLVFMVEERSMAIVLEAILPKVLPRDVTFLVLPHDGKSDLEKSLPRKLMGWRDPDVRFVVLRDNDGADCLAIKRKLVKICKRARRPDTLVRIVCQELESWFLGDMAAVATAFKKPGLAGLQDKKKFRQPDKLGSPSEELKKLIDGYQKISGARDISQHMDLSRNKSESFNIFLNGIDATLRSD